MKNIYSFLIITLFISSAQLSHGQEKSDLAEKQYYMGLANYNDLIINAERERAEVNKKATASLSDSVMQEFLIFQELRIKQNSLIQSAIEHFNDTENHTRNFTAGKKVFIENGQAEKITNGAILLNSIHKNNELLYVNESMEDLLLYIKEVPFGEYVLSTDILYLKMLKIHNLTVEKIILSSLLAKSNIQ